MSVRLKISYEGTEPGLAEHRLSLGRFAQPLGLLTTAFRTIAFDRWRLAVGGKAMKARPGSWRKFAEADGIDLELTGMFESSAGLNIACVSRPGAQPLFPGWGAGLLLASADELLDSVRDEAKGHLRNAEVRTYLSKLPKGVTFQKYVLSAPGREDKVVEVTGMALAHDLDLPGLMEVVGVVAGVGFEDGKHEVRLRDAKTGMLVVGTATSAQVEKALDLRGKAIRAMLLTGKRARLLWLRPASEPARLTAQEVRERIIEKWEPLLRGLDG